MNSVQNQPTKKTTKTSSDPAPAYRVEGYRSAKALGGHYFWRLRAKNGEIVADSSESYHNKKDVLDIVNKIFSGKWPISWE